MAQATKRKKRAQTSSRPPEVLTLAEAARFLKLPAKQVERLALDQGLPGRKIGRQWRFLRTAVEKWLTPNGTASVLSQFGAFKDDPTYDEFRKILEANRRRWDEDVA